MEGLERLFVTCDCVSVFVYGAIVYYSSIRMMSFLEHIIYASYEIRAPYISRYNRDRGNRVYTEFQKQHRSLIDI